MEFLKDRKNLYILGSIVLALALIGGVVFWVNNYKTTQEKEFETIVLTQDAGFDLGGSGLNREVFLRYRLTDIGIAESDSEGSFLNISKDNAEVFLTHPDGTQEEITSELWYIPFRLYPPQLEGTYQLTVKLNSGEVYERQVEFSKPKKVNLVPVDKTKIQEKPESPIEESDSWYMPEGYDVDRSLMDFNIKKYPDFTVEEEAIWNALSETGRDSRKLTAFTMEGVDITQVDFALYIDTTRSVYHSNVPGENINEYFWMDFEYMDSLRVGDYIFLAKDGDQWYYAVASYPEDFK